MGTWLPNFLATSQINETQLSSILLLLEIDSEDSMTSWTFLVEFCWANFPAFCTLFD